MDDAMDDEAPDAAADAASVEVTVAPERAKGTGLPGMSIAAAASIGAGIVHAGAIGIHAEHVTLARLFIAVAVFQLGWGVFALVRPGRLVAAIGAAGNLIAVSAWLVTRLAGVSFIGGLEVREKAQFSDTACALLGLVAAGLMLSALLVGPREARPVGMLMPGLAVAALAVAALVNGAGHVHSHTIASAAGAAVTTTADTTGHVHPGSGSGAAADPGSGATASTIDESQPHVHNADGTVTVLGDPTSTTGTTGTDGSPATTIDESQPHVHDASATPQAVATVPYDPTKPIDLGGVPGVTPEEQARAENLVAITIVRLPQWADPKTAEAAGFQSIGDGLTGFEHYIQWSWINDNDYLDPDHPESLVYAPQPDGSKKLVSAMYMLPDTVKLDQVPDIGGALTQWHIHDNLCFTKDPVAPKVAGITDANGGCPPSLQKFQPAPMIHVWITPNRCGPFAALEGVGAGQIVEGQERLCDHVHGASAGLLG